MSVSDNAGFPSAAPAHVTDELLDWCKARLSASAVPVSITVLPQLPVSAGGKLVRGALPPPAWAAEGSGLPFEAASKGNSVPLDDSASPTSAALTRDSPAPAQQAPAVPSGSACPAPEVISRTTERETHARDTPSQEHGTRLLPAVSAQVSEGRVLGLFREALGLPRLEPTDNFFNAGGDSLAAAAVANALLIQPDMVTGFPTARALAAAMRHSSSASPIGPRVLPRPGQPRTTGMEGGANAAGLSPASQVQSQAMQIPRLQVDLDSQPVATSAAEVTEWQQQAQQELLSHSEAGGWVLERAGALRWAGLGNPTNWQQILEDLEYINHNAAVSSSNVAALATAGCEQQLSNQQQQPAKEVPHRNGRTSVTSLNLAWRVKLKECVDAAPSVLVTNSSSSSSISNSAHVKLRHAPPDCCKQLQCGAVGAGKLPDSQQGGSQLQPWGSSPELTSQQSMQQLKIQQQQQQQQQQEAREWVFACSHGGDVVCMDGQSGRAVWRAELPARAEAGLTTTSDCKVT